MEDSKKHLDSLAEIKNLMERSSKFISLSGLSGVVAGITALIGAVAAYFRMDYYINSTSFNYRTGQDVAEETLNNLMNELFIIAGLVLIISVSTGVLLTIRETKKNKQSIWDKNSKLLLLNLLIPLCAGGIFSLILIYHQFYVLVASVTLIFYGLALVNCSKYTLNDIRYLGISEIVLGLLSAFFVGKGLLFWSIGFGILHIIYGTMMHLKYNRK